MTSGVFYDPDSTTFARWKRTGHIGVEMEAAMMYTIAAVHGIEALAMMTVSDLLGESGESDRISDDDLKRGVDQMMRLACQVCRQLVRQSRSASVRPAERDMNEGCQLAPPLASATFCLPALIHGIIARSWAPTTSIGCSLPSSWRRW